MVRLHRIRMWSLVGLLSIDRASRGICGTTTRGMHRIIQAARPHPQVGVVGASILSGPVVGAPDLLHLVKNIPGPVWVPEIGLGVVELLDAILERVSKLPSSVGLVATFEIGQQTCHHCVGGPEEDGRRSSPVVLEGPKHRQRRRHQDLQEKQSVRQTRDKPVLDGVRFVRLSNACSQ